MRSKKSVSRKNRPIIRPPKVYEPPPPLPSIAELIAEARELGEDDIADAFEKIRYLESPSGQRALKRRERGYD